MRQDWPGSTVFRAACLSGTFASVTKADRMVSRYDSKSQITELNS